MKILLDEMKHLRIERGNINTDFVQIEEQEQKPVIEDVEEIALGDNFKVEEEPKQEKKQMDIDEAIKKGMSFSDWLTSNED